MLGWCSQLPGKRVRQDLETREGIKACFLLTYSVAKSLGQGCFFPEPKPENILTNALISLTARSFQMACVPASVLIQLWVKGKN